MEFLCKLSAYNSHIISSLIFFSKNKREENVTCHNSQMGFEGNTKYGAGHGRISFNMLYGNSQVSDPLVQPKTSKQSHHENMPI